MSRLIDADVLLEYIKKLECHAENKKYEKGLNDFLQFYFPQIIDNQPTAFDTEQVIHNLECEKTIWVGKKITTTEVMKIDDAIDIVKKGGVE